MKEPNQEQLKHYEMLKGRTIRDVIWIDDPKTGRKFPALVLNWTHLDRISGEVPLAVITIDREGNGYVNHNLKGESQ